MGSSEHEFDAIVAFKDGSKFLGYYEEDRPNRVENAHYVSDIASMRVIYNDSVGEFNKLCIFSNKNNYQNNNGHDPIPEVRGDVSWYAPIRSLKDLEHILNHFFL